MKLTLTEIENFRMNMKVIDHRARKEGMTWGELCGYEAEDVLHWVIFHDNDLIYKAITEAGLAIRKENRERKLGA